MAFVPVPKDLNRVKTKVMFNLTKRQLICFAVAAVIGVPVYFLTKPSLGITTAAMLMVVLMLPCIFFALYEKDGQPAEKVLDHMIKAMFLRDRCTCREQQGKKADTVDSHIAALVSSLEGVSALAPITVRVKAMSITSNRFMIVFSFFRIRFCTT